MRVLSALCCGLSNVLEFYHYRYKSIAKVIHKDAINSEIIFLKEKKKI